MRVRFWGTRGSIATPGPDTNRFGGNTACVEVRTESGHLFILDSGTGARLLGNHLLGTRKKPPAGTPAPAIRANFLITHSHWDHIQGFPFFAPVFEAGNEFAVYSPVGGSQSLHEVLAGQMQYTYFPVELDQLPSRIAYNELAEGTLSVDGVAITTQYVNHPAMTLGYRLEADGVTVVYVTDHEPFSETLWRSGSEPGQTASILHEGDRRHASFLTGADLVIHDAQYTPEEYPSRKNWGHSTYEYAVGVAVAAGVKRLALIHHDPTHADAFLFGVEQRAVRLARELGSALEVFCAYETGGVAFASRPARQGASGPASSAGETLKNRPLVLIVDDDPDLIRLAKRSLRDGEYVVRETTSAREALRILDTARPDLVVLDLMMPEMSGLDVLKLLRARRPDTAAVPVLILTVLGDEQSVQSCFELGATDHLTKPFSMPQFAARVRAILLRTQR